MIHLKFFLGSIYLLSALTSLVFALVIFTLRRNARILREKRWATPFAYTFFVLAAIFLLRFFNLLIEEHLRGRSWVRLHNLIFITIFACSGVTNYLLLISAFRLSEPAIDKQRFLLLNKFFKNRAYVRHIALALLLFAGLIKVGAEIEFVGARASTWFRLPDGIFSAFALILMGLVLYQNINSRRDRFMARVALLSSIGYGALYLLNLGDGILYLIQSISPGEMNQAASLAKLLALTASLILKFGLFFPGYALMLLISGPVGGIERLLSNVTRKQKEYLESSGILRSICEELQLSHVNLYIKLPGSYEHQIAHFAYPSSTNGNHQEPRKSPYRAGTDYDQVMKRGQAHSHYNEKSYARIVRVQEISKVTVPVYFHNSVIACLEAEIGEERFTEADHSNFERIATMMSPAVQAYREMAALNRANQVLTQLQIDVTEYVMERDVRRITEIFRNIMSPLAAGISIEIGFSEYRCISSPSGQLEELLKAQLDEVIRAEHVIDEDGAYRWLKKELEISIGDSVYQKIGKQVFGKFIFVTEKEEKKAEHPTMGTNPTFRRVISDLLTDTLLDFVRGYLNQLTDRLGVRLAGLKGTSVADWRQEVEKTAQESKILWVVASYPNGETRLGDDSALEIVKGLESPDQKDNWKNKEEDLGLYSFDQPQAETFHVIKKVLKHTRATLWLGVARQGFGSELDYVSPWKYFLYNFCKIADSALQRILDMERRRKDLAEAQSIAVAMMTTGNVIHRLVGHAVGLIETAGALNIAIKDGRLRGNEHHKEMIASFLPTCDKIEDLVKLLTGVFKPDERRPCSLDEAVKYALELVEGSALKYGITIVPEIPLDAVIDIPFHAAANTIAIVLDNAKDAIRHAKVKNGIIQITVRETEDKFICDIIDDGPGVPPDVVPKILKEVSKSNKPNSHGVGLYFSLHLLQAFNGDIILTDPGPSLVSGARRPHGVSGEIIATPPGPEPKTTFSIIFPKPDQPQVLVVT